MSTLLPSSVSFAGVVVRGEQRGRRLGFPTANIQVAHPPLPPGIYAGFAQVASASPTRYGAAIHIGPRPTFNDTTNVVEVHLLQFPGHELYGLVLHVDVLGKIRSVKKFSSPAALQTAIAKDCQKAAAFLANVSAFA